MLDILANLWWVWLIGMILGTAAMVYQASNMGKTSPIGRTLIPTGIFYLLLFGAGLVHAWRFLAA